MANPEIVKQPATNGFLRGGSETAIPLDDWRYQVEFVGGPCEPSKSYPNITSVCRTEDDPQNPILELGRLGEYDPKEVSETSIFGPFYPWPVYDIQVCGPDDKVKPVDRERVVNQLNNHRSRRFAREFSDGVFSGSPSLRSVGVPVSNTSFLPLRAVGELIQARVDAGVSGPHIVHVPLVLRPFFEDVSLVSNEDYRIVYDDYSKSYVPDANVVGGGSATAPTSAQAWIGVTGAYEYDSSPIVLDDDYTIESKKGNLKSVKGEQQMFYRFETCGVFLAKVTVFA